MLCVGEIHGTIATTVWQTVVERVRDRSMQGQERSEATTVVGGEDGSPSCACIGQDPTEQQLLHLISLIPSHARRYIL